MAIFEFVPIDYLHKIDVDKLAQELHVDVNGVALLAGKERREILENGLKVNLMELDLVTTPL